MPPASPIWIAHRGASSVAPENTLPAIRKAIDRRADSVELDVRCTRDNRIVLMHDDTVNRTTDGTGRVRDLTLRQIRRLDAGKWFAPKFKGIRAPTLGQALRVLKGKAIPVVEIKDPDIGDAVAAELRREAMLADAVIISFDETALQGAASVEPRIASLLLFAPEDGKKPDARQLVLRARECGATGLDLHHACLTAELVRNIKRRGLSIWAWTVDDPARAAKLAAMGVDGITTNAGRLRLPRGK